MTTIKKQINDKLFIYNSANNLDKPLAYDLPEPLPNYNGFSMLIVGPSSSGKTTWLYSIMTTSKKNGVRQSYKNLFDYIYIISPTIGSTSMKKDKFMGIPQNQKWKSITFDGLVELKETLIKNKEDNKNSIVIFDDVGSQLKKSQAIEHLIVELVQNRRHYYTCFIILAQKFKDFPTGLRGNISHFVTFRPKNTIESMSITDELFQNDHKINKEIMKYVFNDKDTKKKGKFLFIDMSLMHSNKFIFYDNFDRLIIDE